jgi:hypothetical protein
MDPFVGFTFVELDASDPKKVRILRKEQRRERVDLIARQFHDDLTARDPADPAPHGMVLSPEFKIASRVTPAAGWLTFLTDQGDGKDESLKEVATVVFATRDDRETLRRLDPYIHANELPPPPFVVAVRLVPTVPSLIREWSPKSVAAFFTP